MKKFIIAYIFISLLLAVVLYFTTLTLSYNERVYEIFQQFSEEAVLNQDFDPFVSYQSIQYKNIDQVETEDYLVFIYHIIGSEEKGYTNQLAFFILPVKDVRHALKVDDPFDQTKMVIKESLSDEVIYDTSTDNAYDQIAVSFGIDKMGYYFYTFNIDRRIELLIQFDDYDGNLIQEIRQAFEYQAYPNVDASFIHGITQEEIQQLIDQETTIYPKLMKNMTIYIIVVVLFGSALYFLIKHKKNHL